MTPPNPDQASPTLGAPEESADPVSPGIYLQEKKSSIGTGGTAKVTEYRTFWVTLLLDEASVEMLLLDDDFRPTGIRETFDREAILGPGWHYIAEGEKRYQRMKPYLDRLSASKPEPAAKTAKADAAKANWWGGGESGGPAKDPFALDKKKKNAAPPKKGGWWDK